MAKRDYYEILGVPLNASNDEIRKGYRKKALIHHPDKGGNPENFRALCYVCTILTNEESRKLYDETGEIDGDSEGDATKDFEEWYNYYRALFPKITATDIIKFSDEYKGSTEERSEIFKYYDQYKGDVEKVIESVILLESDEAPRVCGIISEGISLGEIPSYPKFSKFQKQNQASSSGSNNSVNKKQKLTNKVEKNTCSLESLILSRNQAKETAFDTLINKYSKPTSSKSKQKQAEPMISDEEFNRLREKVTKKK